MKIIIQLVPFVILYSCFMSCYSGKKTLVKSNSQANNNTTISESFKDEIKVRIGKLHSSSYKVRADARDELILIGKPAVPYVIEATKSTDFGLRWEAVNILGYIKDKKAWPSLLHCVLKDDDNHVRWRSIWALSQIVDDTLVDDVKESLKSENKKIRWNAAVASSVLEIQEALPVIIEGLSSSSSWIKWEAINALGKIHDEKTIDLLTPILRDNDVKIRQEATLTIGKIGGIQAIEALKVALSDSEPQVRWRAAMGLGSIGDKKSIPFLEEALKKEMDRFTKKEIRGAIINLKKELHGNENEISQIK